MFTTYILYSESRDRYYIGSSQNPDQRLIQHNSGRNKSTKTGIPWKVVHQEHFETLTEARARENFIKKMKSREFILKVISGER